MAVRVGTSGWSYPTGAGRWNGVFYPASRSTRGGSRPFDELSFYAEYFETVEVNSTFYRPPTPEMTKSWVQRTPSGFDFSLKLYQKFTHPGMFKESALRRAPGGPGELLDLLALVTESDLDGFRVAIEPLVNAHKLGALLAQFPASFKASGESRDYLARLLNAFGDYPLAVELRHSSWSDAYADTLALLGAFRTAWVQIDEPKFRFSIRQNQLPNVDTFYYMRLHGRNTERWWHHARSEDRYDYLYSEEELREFSSAASASDALVKKSYLYTNNHFSAKSVVNAVMLKAQLGHPITGDYPSTLVESYPQLSGLVRSSNPAPTPVRLFS